MPTTKSSTTAISATAPATPVSEAPTSTKELPKSASHGLDSVSLWRFLSAWLFVTVVIVLVQWKYSVRDWEALTASRAQGWDQELTKERRQWQDQCHEKSMAYQDKMSNLLDLTQAKCQEQLDAHQAEKEILSSRLETTTNLYSTTQVELQAQQSQQEAARLEWQQEMDTLRLQHAQTTAACTGTTVSLQSQLTELQTSCAAQVADEQQTCVRTSTEYQRKLTEVQAAARATRQRLAEAEEKWQEEATRLQQANAELTAQIQQLQQELAAVKNQPETAGWAANLINQQQEEAPVASEPLDTVETNAVDNAPEIPLDQTVEEVADQEESVVEAPADDISEGTAADPVAGEEALSGSVPEAAEGDVLEGEEVAPEDGEQEDFDEEDYGMEEEYYDEEEAEEA
jgi:myosin heavy subunit